MDVTVVLPILVLGGMAVLGALAGKLVGSGHQPPTPVRVPVPAKKPRSR
jgi:hypothetical protein